MEGGKERETTCRKLNEGEDGVYINKRLLMIWMKNRGEGEQEREEGRKQEEGVVEG